MIVVLHLIALAMVGAGLAAVSFGSGIVSLERGWTMVISGAVVTSAGIVVLGIAAILVRLNGLAAELARIREALARPAPPLPAPPELLRPAEPAIIAAAVTFGDEPSAEPVDHRPRRFREMPAFEAAPDTAQLRLAEPEVVAAPTIVAEEPTIEPVERKLERRWARPTVPTDASLPPEPIVASFSPDRSAAPVMTPMQEQPVNLPDPHSTGPFSEQAELDSKADEPPVSPAPLPDAEPESELAPEPDESAAAFPEMEAVEHDAPIRFDPPLPMANGAGDDVDAAVVDDPAAEPDDRAVIGSYSSGENSYVMYADGSIQAHTPTGLYRFGSLDELKRFLSSGSEAARASIAKA